MIRRHLLLAFVLISLSLAGPAFAEEVSRPDDTVGFSITAEDWVTTKTVHVTLNVEAAVSAATAGSMREDMIKAVNEVAKGDWRLVGFNRSQDQTGLDRWSAVFESRLPESSLGNLSDAAKKASKAGMEISVSDADFSPTLDETEAVEATLRTRLYKQAADQLAALNAALPGRSYRLSHVIFEPGTAQQQAVMRPVVAMKSAMASISSMQPASLEHSEKMTLSAHVVYASIPPSSAIH